MIDHGTHSHESEMIKAIDEIYAFATDARRFHYLPERLAWALESRAANIWCSTTNLQSVSIANFGLTDQQLRDYLENWLQDDALVATTMDVGTGFGKAIRPESHFGQNGYRALPVVEGFYRPNDRAADGAIRSSRPRLARHGDCAEK